MRRARCCPTVPGVMYIVPTIILCGLPKEETLEIRAELERMGDITVEIRALD